MSNIVNGLLTGVGLIFGVMGTVSAVQDLLDEDSSDDKQKVVSSHMQIYAGYFLMLLMAWLLMLACRVWSEREVNYQLIFELDPRLSCGKLKALTQFPSLFTLLFGVAVFLNFNTELGGEVMFLYYPVVLIAATLLVLFLPLPVLHHRSRLWFAVAHWHLLMVPFYPVTFSDALLGDIYTSLRYSFSDIELLFCVYIEGWEEPERCGSSRSRLMGFLSALPFVWRTIQCLRRWFDTRDAFPHLANWLKYVITIGTVVALSEYRIHGGGVTLSFFISLSVLSTIYSSYWDMVIDFQLGHRQSRHYLREILAFDSLWWYKGAIIINPILRMTWILFVIFDPNIQHSNIVSFIVALLEVFRRGLWVVFRVESEHCANIARRREKERRDLSSPRGLWEANPSRDLPSPGGLWEDTGSVRIMT
ncbi:EXS family-domain-containing protein [Immersiella caudata]|uniref:EXS family-domain-containing protein n=1 Tax=Immersiella caudata TaxID=314043 RepID=A0AA40BXX3_9PEZI|nr:EXS family-domain-containing protein [Immersiella caudata]